MFSLCMVLERSGIAVATMCGSSRLENCSQVLRSTLPFPRSILVSPCGYT
uniref:Uncharacterized protein n=1 Tax=Octopus bimaculoides TaxID=37653 RepID=A0A0L8GNL5_OCTBM